MDPLKRLSRDDKWYLGGGTGSIFAPKFPKWFPHVPGFWDECYHADLKVERLFTVHVVDGGGKLLQLQSRGVSWQPDCLTQTYAGPDLEVIERKLVTSQHAFVSHLSFRNSIAQPRRLHLLQWGIQDRKQMLSTAYDNALVNAEVTDTSIRWTQRYQYPYRSSTHTPLPFEEERRAQGHEGDLHLELACSLPRVSYLINLSELTDLSPNWWVSVFPEKFRSGSLPNETKLGVGWNPYGYVHMAQHYALDLPAGGEETAVFSCAASFDVEEAADGARAGISDDVVKRSHAGWEAYFDSVPRFECDNPFLTHYYWYRWYGMRLNTVDMQRHTYQRPCVMEGVDMFRCYITYSAQAHMREAAWMHDPRLAEGSLLGEIHNQNPDGSFKGHIYSLRPERGFYHANWGANALRIYAIHGNRQFLADVFEPLKRYAEYFDTVRDREGSHLYDIVNQDETGQEYMSRYLFVDERADEWGNLQMKGVDSTYYIYELQRALGGIAEILGEPDAELWRARAADTKAAMLRLMWDPELKFFCDIDPKTNKRSPMKSAVCFYPFMGDIVDQSHLPMIHEHLLNPAEFWTEFPVPASSLDDPYFNAEGEWKGKRTRCPWNGRVWPMANSHIAEALANAARTLDPNLRRNAAEFTEKFVKMMFFEQDPARPNCFEHYNPFTGVPCLYRGIDDYQHSWVVDLIMAQVVGIVHTLENKLIIDPLPFAIKHFACDRIRYRGHDVAVKWSEAGGLEVTVDGKAAATAPDRQRLEIEM